MVKNEDVASVLGGKLLQSYIDRDVVTLAIDSRKALCTSTTLFFAISGSRHDGHHFICELYEKGVRQFVVEREIDRKGMEEANFFLVQSSIEALQSLAIYHRNQFNIPVIGVTGSNGKTIVKEWLYQLLSPEHHVVKNPGSYNSQLGVPLSVWAMKDYHTIAVFEAGISTVNEMSRLAQIIRPTIGLITNLGTAHDEGFSDHEQKLSEKLDLFEGATKIIYRRDHLLIKRAIEERYKNHVFSWGMDPHSTMVVSALRDKLYSFSVEGRSFVLEVPFNDAASIENALHCIALMYCLGYEPQAISDRFAQLRSIPMRLELKQGINHCQIIDDTYNNDLAGLQISLNFLSGMKKAENTLVLSDLLQSGLAEEVWVERVAETLNQSGVTRFVGVGQVLKAHHLQIERLLPSRFFDTTDDFLESRVWEGFQNEVVLVKGARTFKFERIVQKLQRKIHGTIMEVDLSAIVHNLNYFRSSLNPGVQLMVMVKAFAYGSGSEEVTHLLQYHKVSYLGVAYPDEGVDLRKNHIHLPIMVMNPSEESFPTLLEFELEPEVFSLNMLTSLITFLNGRPCNVHLKLDTGMHRLGFEEQDLDQLISLLQSSGYVKVVSVFSHLAAADEPDHDEFTRMQASRFLQMANKIMSVLQINPMLHLLNSSGIIRFPELQFDMVRLGIGLYGVDPTEDKAKQLKPAATLKTVISQIKKISAGETVGYGRRGKFISERVVATIAIGYADGFSRGFSRGVGSVLINGKLGHVVGNVCMDMTMIDITGIAAKEGDEVVIFGPSLPIQEIAAKINTIPYEILTGINERVKRVFYTESI